MSGFVALFGAVVQHSSPDQSTSSPGVRPLAAAEDAETYFFAVAAGSGAIDVDSQPFL